MTREQEIKAALYELYAIARSIAQTSGGKSILAPAVLEILVYSEDEVQNVLDGTMGETGEPLVEESVLTIVDQKPTVEQASEEQAPKAKEETVSEKEPAISKVSPRIGRVTDRDGVRKLYYEEMIQYFDPALEKAKKTKLERSFKVDDLCYLYSILSAVGVKGKKKKAEIFQLFKDYYDDDMRTAAMNKKLSGK